MACMNIMSLVFYFLFQSSISMQRKSNLRAGLDGEGFVVVFYTANPIFKRSFLGFYFCSRWSLSVRDLGLCTWA